MRKTFPNTVKYVNLNEVILLEKDQWVYCKASPSYFEQRTSPYATHMISGLVQIGVATKRLVTSHGLRASIKEMISGLFEYYHIPLNSDVLDRYLKFQVPDIPDEPLIVPPGLYRVDQIEILRAGRKFSCSTYMPTDERPKRDVYFYLETHQAANHDIVKVVKNPDQYLGEDISKIFFSTLV